jgi:hypothetical protein
LKNPIFHGLFLEKKTFFSWFKERRKKDVFFQVLQNQNFEKFWKPNTFLKIVDNCEDQMDALVPFLTSKKAKSWFQKFMKIFGKRTFF